MSWGGVTFLSRIHHPTRPSDEVILAISACRRLDALDTSSGSSQSSRFARSTDESGNIASGSHPSFLFRPIGTFSHTIFDAFRLIWGPKASSAVET